VQGANWVGNGTVEGCEPGATPPGIGDVQVAVAYTGVYGTGLHVLCGNMDSHVRRLSVLVLSYEFHKPHGGDVGAFFTRWRPGGRDGWWGRPWLMLRMARRSSSASRPGVGQRLRTSPARFFSCARGPRTT